MLAIAANPARQHRQQQVCLCVNLEFKQNCIILLEHSKWKGTVSAAADGAAIINIISAIMYEILSLELCIHMCPNVCVYVAAE